MREFKTIKEVDKSFEKVINNISFILILEYDQIGSRIFNKRWRATATMSGSEWETIFKGEFYIKLEDGFFAIDSFSITRPRNNTDTIVKVEAVIFPEIKE